jgi:hypothetical protein
MTRPAASRFSRALSLALLTAAGCPSLPAQESPPPGIQSRSGQFVVTSRVSAPARTGTNKRPGGFVELDVPSLVVSSERIKTALLLQLGVADAWQGRIHLTLVPALRPDQNVVIASTLFRDGWRYEVEIPSELAEQKLVRALINVLLMEFANRQSTGRSPEVPLWLTDGLGGILAANTAGALIFEAGQATALSGSGGAILQGGTGTHVQIRRPDAIRLARQRFQHRAALSFDDLSWPRPEHLSGDGADDFRLCAELFVTQLLRLRDGRANLRRFVQLLPRHLNWQTSFLQAFGQRFPRLLDVEKWWAVELANLTGRTDALTLPAGAALQKLDQLLRVTARIRVTPQDLPRTAQVALQDVIEQWPFDRQKPALRDICNQLAPFRWTVPPELLPLVDAYRAALDRYLIQREQAGTVPPVRGQVVTTPTQIARETVKRLDDLDARREQARQQLRPENAAR